ncbi:MAG: hypothetical protein LIO58_01440, partial [Oscillospiraceae bacterium]|nr:hypothetical protein [Oscillospiraceae bacterium]
TTVASFYYEPDVLIGSGDHMAYADYYSAYNYEYNRNYCPYHAYYNTSDSSTTGNKVDALFGQADALWEIACAMEEAMQATGKTTRYATSPTVIAEQYEKYVKGIYYYVSNQIDKGAIDKKIIAINPRYDADTWMWTLTYDTGRIGQYTENLFYDMYELYAESDTDSITLTTAELIEMTDVIVRLENSDYSGISTKDAIEREGLSYDGIIIDSLPLTAYSLLGDSHDNAMGIPLFAGIAYYDQDPNLNPVNLIAYYAEKFYHVSAASSNLQYVIKSMFRDDLGGLSYLPAGLTLDLTANNYSSYQVEAMITKGLTYAQEIGAYTANETLILEQPVTIASDQNSATGRIYVSATQTGMTSISIIPDNASNLSAFATTGNFYPFDSGAYAGKRLVGDFTVENNSNYTVTDARIEKESSSDITLSFSVLDRSKNTTYNIGGKISSGNYDSINTYAQAARTKYLASNDQADYNDLLVKLDLKVESSSESTIVSDTSTSSTQPAQLISAYTAVTSNSPKKELEDFSFLELNTLLDGIRTCDTGILWLSNLDFEVSSEFFTEPSTKIETYADTSSNIKYRVYKYNFQDLHGSYLTRITLMQYIKHSDVNTSSGKPQFEVKIANSLIVEYNGAGGVLLYLDDAGFKISNIKLLIDNVRVTDTAHSDTELFFKSFVTTGRVSSTSETGLLLASNAAVVIASFIPVAQWGALLSSMVAVITSSVSISEGDNGLNEGDDLFYETAEDQMEAYGDLIRSIQLDCQKAYLISRGDRLVLTGYLAYDNIEYDYDWKVLFNYSSI